MLDKLSKCRSVFLMAETLSDEVSEDIEIWLDSIFFKPLFFELVFPVLLDALSAAVFI